MKHLLDLRDELEQEAEPLTLYFEDFESTSLSLHDLEHGRCNLPDLPYLVVCEVGQKSKLAVLYLQSDGYQATHLEGGVLGLRKLMEKEFLVPYTDTEHQRLIKHPRVRFIAVENGTMRVWGTLSEQEACPVQPGH